MRWKKLSILLTILWVTTIVFSDIIIYKQGQTIDLASNTLDLALEVIQLKDQLIMNQQDSLENLSILNIAYQMYIITGNESWLPKGVWEISGYTIDNTTDFTITWGDSYI